MQILKILRLDNYISYFVLMNRKFSKRMCPEYTNP